MKVSNVCETLLHPRSEYRTRFNGSSAFEMSDPRFNNTYYRSQRDRLAKTKRKTVRRNSKVNRDTKTKLYLSGNHVISGETYQKIIDYTRSKYPNAKSQRVKHVKHLRDDILQYKLTMCDIVVQWYQSNVTDPDVMVYYENDYPCVMVQVKAFGSTSNERSSLYEITMAYFIGIANKLAVNNGIPIELVIRTGFGHTSPGVAQTKNTFRIDIGIIPKVYAEKVLATGLKILNEELPHLLNKQIFNESDEEILLEKNKTIHLYNRMKEVKKFKNNKKRSVQLYKKFDQLALTKQHKKIKLSVKVQQWEKDDTVLKLLLKTGDSSGKTTAFQIMREPSYVDILANYCAESYMKTNQLSVDPLKKMLFHLQYNDVVTIQNDVVSNDYNAPKIDFVEDNSETKEDSAFWTITQKLSVAFKNIQGLPDAFKLKKVQGLYRWIEEAHSRLLSLCAEQNCEDGYGSDSCCEIITSKIRKVYHIKTTVASGMRAINAAHFIALNCTGCTSCDTTYMYYETKAAIKKICDLGKNLTLSCNPILSQTTVRFIDLNHCNSSGPNTEVVPADYLTPQAGDKVIVVDITSSTHAKIREIIEKFMMKVEVLLLVSSAIKNEQMGADINPHGTLRIIVKDENLLHDLHLFIRVALGREEKLPKQLHAIRKLYKIIGATLTAKAICGEEWTYKKVKTTTSQREEIPTEIETDSQEHLEKVWMLLFSLEYRDEMEILCKIGKRNVNEVIEWDLQTIRDLGSESVRLLVSTNDVEYFDGILNSYEKRSSPTAFLLDSVNEDNVERVNDSFEAVLDRYEDFEDDFEQHAGSGDNIIDWMYPDTENEMSRKELTGLANKFIDSDISIASTSSDEYDNYDEEKEEEEEAEEY